MKKQYLPPPLYVCGVSVGFGLGLFVVGVLTEDGMLTPDSAAWQWMKFVGLALIVAGGIWMFRLRSKNPA